MPGSRHTRHGGALALLLMSGAAWGRTPGAAPTSAQPLSCPALDDAQDAARLDSLVAKLKARPDDLETLFYMAGFAFRLGRLPQARESFETLIQLEGGLPWLAPSWNALGEILILEGKPSAALAYFEKTIGRLEKRKRLSPKDAEALRGAHNGKGWVYCLNGDYEKALKMFPKGMDDPWGLHGMALALAGLKLSHAALWDLRWALFRYSAWPHLPGVLHQRCLEAVELAQGIEKIEAATRSVVVPNEPELSRMADAQKRRAAALHAGLARLVTDQRLLAALESDWKNVESIVRNDAAVREREARSHKRAREGGELSEDQIARLTALGRRSGLLRSVDAYGTMWPGILKQSLPPGLAAGLDLAPAMPRDELDRWHHALSWQTEEVVARIYDGVARASAAGTPVYLPRARSASGSR